MEAMRESWTDDRLDDLNGKVDVLRVEMRTEFVAVRGEMKDEFAAVRGEVKDEFTAVRAEMRDGFDRVDTKFDRIDERFQVLDARLIGIYRTMVVFCGAAMAALIAAIATQV
jgi:hypothetical protein